MGKYKRKVIVVDKPLQFKYAARGVAILVVYSAIIAYFIKIILNSALTASAFLSSASPEEVLRIHQQNGKIFILMVVILLLNAFLAGIFWLVSMHKITGPIYRLKKGIGEIKAGKLPAEIHLRKGDELSEIADNFNEMVSFLRDAARRDADAAGLLLEKAQLLREGLRGAQSLDAEKLGEFDSLVARLGDFRERKLGFIAA
jgi:nitrogen fixation/metabolism regulation signal transduction histidine kinase